MPERIPSRRRPPPKPAAAQPDVAVNVQGNVDGELYVAGGDINVTQYSREDRILTRSRAALLDKVNEFWCEGVLEKSLHGVAMLDLGLRSSDDAVGHPWETVVKSLDTSQTQAIPANQTIVDVFNSMGRALLILGQPGSGKTITLLELARDLIQSARKDADQPLPVVFNLSSWIGGTISRWLVDELADKYGVPHTIGAQWVDSNDLALMLDGLDEVHEEYRADCVEAINKFRIDHGLAPMAVTCRDAEYEAIGKHLSLTGAVTLQPLTEKQVDGYLRHTGDEYASLRRAIKDDPALHELAQSPLMLTVMMLAYKGAEIKDIPGGNTVQARRRHLFDQYIERMLAHQPARSPFSAQDILKYLKWIALRMTETNQSIFLLERIQPRWLTSRFLRWSYGTIQRVIGIPLLALGVACLTMALIMLVQGVLAAIPPEVALARWAPIIILGSIGFGEVIGFVAARDAHADIVTVENLRWSWGWSWRQARLGGLVGGSVALAVGLIAFFYLASFKEAIQSGGAVMLYTLGRTLTFWWLFALCNALSWSILFGLLFGGLRPVEIETTRPNQGIRRSFSSGQRVGLSVLLGLGVLLVPMVFSLEYFVYHETFKAAITGGAVTGLSVATLASFVMGLQYGALPVIQHITVRALLTFTGAIPVRLVRLLDTTSDLVLTRRVGGGYIFVHRLLLEHMAGVDGEKAAAPARPSAELTAGTAYWFVPQDARSRINFARVRRVLRRVYIGLAILLALAMLGLMVSANLIPNLFAIGQGAPLGGIGALGYFPDAVGWSPDSTLVATVYVSESGSAEVDEWNAATGAAVKQPYQGGFHFASRSVSPDGHYFVWPEPQRGADAASSLTDLWVWDLTSGQVIQTLGVASNTTDLPLAWSLDGRRVAVGQANKLTVWDALKGRQALSVPLDAASPPLDVIWTVDGDAVAVRTPDGHVSVFRAADGVKIAEFGDGNGVGAFSPDGTQAALNDPASDVGYSIFDLKTGQTVGAFTSEVAVSGQMTGLFWSADGKQIATIVRTITGGFLLTLRDAATGAVLHTEAIQASYSGEVTWSPDGKRVVIATSNGALVIADAANGQRVGTPVWAPTNWVANRPIWSPDGSLIAVVGVDDRSVIVQPVKP